MWFNWNIVRREMSWVCFRRKREWEERAAECLTLVKRQFYVLCTASCQLDFSRICLWVTIYLDVCLLLLYFNDVLWREWMCDECTWHHKTFLEQLYWHLATKMYCNYERKKGKQEERRKVGLRCNNNNQSLNYFHSLKLSLKFNDRALV